MPSRSASHEAASLRVWPHCCFLLVQRGKAHLTNDVWSNTGSDAACAALLAPKQGSGDRRFHRMPHLTWAAVQDIRTLLKDALWRKHEG